MGFDSIRDDIRQLEFRASVRDCGYKLHDTDPWTLLLDLDSREDLATYERQLPRLKDMGVFGEIKEIKRYRTQSGGVHVILRTSKRLTIAEVLTGQMFLGSDPVKEVLSAVREKNYIRPCSFLVEGGWKEDPGVRKMPDSCETILDTLY